jgi:3-oxoadipate enol-lactonase
MRHLLPDGTGLEYEVLGPQEAPALLLMNSLGTDMSMWGQQVPVLSESHRLVTYDQRGQGASDAPPGPYSIEMLGADAFDLMASLGSESFSICGLSMSGQIGLWMAGTQPERILRAIFANTAAVIGNQELWNERIEKVKGEGMSGIRDGVLARFFTPGFIANGSDVVRRFRRMLDEAPPEGYIGGCTAVRDADLRGFVPGIRVPSLIVAGAEDFAAPPEDSEWLADAIPASELKILAGAAHISNAEQPHAFNEVVTRFLGRTDS